VGGSWSISAHDLASQQSRSVEERDRDININLLRSSRWASLSFQLPLNPQPLDPLHSRDDDDEGEC
jgi:hypothetical protein